MAFSKQCKVCTFIFVAAVLIVAIVLLKKYIKVTKYKCEENDELLFKGTNKCYKKGARGPCSETMVLLEREPRSPLGSCSCPYTENARPLLFHWQSNQCFYIYSQAFCDDGFWINVTRKNGEPVCEENYCLKEFEDSGAIPDEIVPLKNGKCAVLHSDSECSNENETVQFYPNRIYPSCELTQISVAGAGVGVRPSECPLGSYPSIVGKCQPDFEF